MKQSEYLRELKENLEAKISHEELKDILADYESFFASGKEEGKTEDEISDGLGSPAFLAKSLLGERQDNHNTQNKNITAPGKRFCAYFIDAFVSIIPVFILTVIVLKYAALSAMLLISYPTPAFGALAYSSYAAFVTVAEPSVRENVYITTQEIPVNGGEGYSVDPSLNKETSKAATAPSVENRKISKIPSPIVSVAAIASILFYLLYSVICTMLFKGQTLGKKLMKIKVKKSDLLPASYGSIFFREFIGKVLINSIPIVPLISFFTILFTREHKALHDMLSDTIVCDL